MGNKRGDTLSAEVADALRSNKPSSHSNRPSSPMDCLGRKISKQHLKLEWIVRENGAVPATIAMFGGEIYAGLERSQIEYWLMLTVSEDIPA